LITERVDHFCLLDVLPSPAGTYNNQYIVVDLNKFQPGSELQPGLLTIVEQMPGLVVSGDLTQVSLHCSASTAQHTMQHQIAQPQATPCMRPTIAKRELWGC
jgi:hypothetical protein